MKLRTKIVASFASITFITFSLFGTYSVNTVEKESVNLLTAKLNSAHREIVSLEDSPITASYNVAENVDFELLVGLYSQSNELLSFSEKEINLTTIKKRDLVSASATAVKISQTGTYLVRSILLEGDTYIVLAVDLAPTFIAIQDLRNRVWFAVLLFSLLSVTFALALIYKDLRAIRILSDESDAIAKGDLSADLSIISGSSELVALSKSISSMAKTLRSQADHMQILIGDISHELKTPLTSIKGYSQLLAGRSDLTAKDIKYLEIMSNEIDNMERLINDLLFISKLGSITYELKDEVVIGDLVERRFSVVRDLQPKRDLKIVNECDFEVKVSEPLLNRLVDNLISNSLTHTKEDVQIVISIYADDETWSIQYEDAGEGLPENYNFGDAADITRFDSRRSAGKGNGLGFSIIKQIVEQHDGKLYLGKSYLGGLLLRITIPIIR